jgi:hypothetical protein
MITFGSKMLLLLMMKLIGLLKLYKLKLLKYVEKHTQILEKYTAHKLLTTYLLRRNPRNKTQPCPMQQEET